jgi:hypothetical protein
LPEERYTSTRISLSGISMLISSVIFGDDVDGAERGVPALVGVERADAHQPVHPALGLGVTVGVLALDQHRRLADAGLVAHLHVLQLDRETAAFGPAVVHAEKHVGPVVGLGAAGAGLDREDGVVAVELPGEKRPDFDGVELLHHAFDLIVELARVGLALGGVGRFDQLDHHAHVVDLLLEGDDREHGLFQAVEFADVFLGALVVVPERRRPHLGLQGLDFADLLFDVKETSTGGRRAS